LGKVHWHARDVACDVLVAADKLHVPAITGAPDFDYVLQPMKTREKKLLIADMDSTMIAQECIDELADLVGKKKEVAAITERAMNGELDFKAALRERVALLKGLTQAQLGTVYRERITLTPGARTLVQTMKARGAYTMLVSGGFKFFTSRVGEAIGFDANEANKLEAKNGILTGKVIEPILDKESKRDSLHRAAKEKGLSLVHTLAIGDGANDLPMIKDAGLGVAYHAKPIVRADAAAQINFNDLSALLYVQGISRASWVS
jgi:phosphoserine phosphatase